MTNAVRNRVVIPAGVDSDTTKPMIINGDMQISQRSVSTASITGDGFHCIDRMKLDLSDNGTWTNTQSTDVPANTGFEHSLKMDCTSADSSLAAGSYHLWRYVFEAQDIKILKKGTANAEYLTVAFYIKSNKTGTFTVEILDEEGDDRNISQTFTIDSADTWEKKVLSFVGDTSAAPTYDNTKGISINIWMTGGSTFTGGTLQTAWGAKTNNERADTSVNIADSTDNEYYITGLQAEVGDFNASTIPEFQFESRIDNLRRCQRYFHIGVGLDGNTTGFANGSFRTNATAQILHQFPVSMRTEPTATQIATDNIIAHDTADGNNINVDSIQSILFNCENNIVVQYTLEGTSAAAGDGCYVYPTGSTPGIKFEAEL